MAYYNILFSGQATIEADTEEEAIEKLTDGSWETTMEVLTNLNIDEIEKEKENISCPNCAMCKLDGNCPFQWIPM